MGYVSGLLYVLLTLLCLCARRGFVMPVRADALVSGTVFCDQCRDGSWGLFDYPLHGAKVAVTCVGGAMTAYKEESTNWVGVYSVRFKGRPDLRHCHARVVGGPDRCGAVAGPPQGLKLFFHLFGTEMYSVSPLFSQPAAPMGFCRKSPSPPRYKPSPSPVPTTPRRSPPIVPVLPPHAPVVHHPPLPFLDASACSFDKWMMPEYKCYWRVVSPSTKVALAFGPVAAGKYGMDMTLWEGLEGKGDLYRTLLREATTALLNSYTSFGFMYPTLTVIDHMNWALLGSSNDAVTTALGFRRANKGSSPQGKKVFCSFSSCS